VKVARFGPLAGFGLLAAVLAVGLTLDARKVPSPFIGKPAPAFTVPDVANAARQVSAADFKGQVWLLNVWASWCAPCRDEHPLLVQLAREPGAAPIVGLNYKDDPRAAQEWLRRLGDPYAASAADRLGQVGIDYGVYGVPETFVVDRDGIVRHKHVGPLTPEVWQRDLLPLIRRLKG
jgi:cytochrome c biogenesis protein CcmG, thiol:disulfide interchange protein DsbE